MSQNSHSRFQLKIVTPTDLLVETEVDEVELPGLDGYIGILPGHRPLNTALGEGTITYREGNKEEQFSVRGGYAEITSVNVIVITELSEDGIDRPSEESG